MPTNVIMSAFQLSQETGKVLRWLKAPGDRVAKVNPTTSWTGQDSRVHQEA